jgi:DNA-binding response OmpR family regulator
VAHILVVEDDELLSHMYERMFGDNGYKVSVAIDGEDCLAQAKRHRPDVILLDVLMPKLDGLTTLKRLKADPKTASVPVLVISSLTDSATAHLALKLGAAKFIQKSDQRPKQVVEIVQEVVPT